MKKLFTLIVFAFAAIYAHAQLFVYDGLVYNILSETDKTCEVASEQNVSGDIIIPETVTYGNSQYNVIAIGDKAFYFCLNLTSVILPESITIIGRLAFYYCKSLISINLPEGLTALGDYAFFCCESLTSITLPEGITSLEESAFEFCSSLSNVTLPVSLTSLGDDAFGSCTNLTSITLPEGITSIGDSAFEFCSSLNTVTLPEGLTSIGDEAFYHCRSLTEITLPAGLTSIGKSAFSGTESLASINVAAENKNYTSIDGVLFSKDLTELIACPGGKSGAYTVPDGVTSIGSGAFEYCQVLTSITLPEGLTSIGKSAFEYCQVLTNITIPEGVTYIGDNAFANSNNFSSFSLPESITFIGDDAFFNCFKLTEINVAAENKNYTSIDGVLFSKDLTELIAYPTAKSGEYTVPDEVTSVKDKAFYWCHSITSVILPEGITSIGIFSFGTCGKLASITLPASLTSIGDCAFYYCESLTRLNSYATKPPVCVDNYTFYAVPSNAVLHVPVGYKDDYASATGWSSFINIIDDLIERAGVDEIQSDNETNDADGIIKVYNLQGRRINISRRSELPSLPAGIYIVNGKKILVK